MTTTRTLSAAVSVLVLAVASGAAPDAGVNAGLVLRLGSGARVPAMGDAGVANVRGASSLHYNPAGLGVTERAEVAAMYQNFVLDIGQGEMRFVHPINHRSAWGVSLIYLDYGKTTRVTLTDIFNDAVTSATFSGRDLVLGASYGQRLTENLFGGATVKLVNGEIDNTSATAFAADLGLLARAPGWPVRFGLSVQNLGTSMKFDRVKNDLPLLVRGGVAIDLFDNRQTIAVDVEKVRNQDVTVSVGGEAHLMELLALRVGYDGRIDADKGLTAGFGVKVADMAIDYVYVPFGRFGNSHRVGMTYQFGPKY